MTKRRRERFERSKIIIPILLAGWIPSVLTLIVSYTILRDTLESRILRDRQTLVQLLGHVVRTDLSRSSEIINYYESLPEVARILSSPNPAPPPNSGSTPLSIRIQTLTECSSLDRMALCSHQSPPRQNGRQRFGANYSRQEATASGDPSCRRFIPGSPITAL